MELAVCVWQTVREINCIIWFLKVVSKCHFIKLLLTKTSLISFAESTALVADLETIKAPLIVFSRLDADAHTLFVKTRAFSEVDNRECCMAKIGLILNRKVKPLVMTTCVCVNSHVKTELTFVCLNNHV